ncbi:MAG: MMPL family transporter [Pseudomonadota bacterium]
MTDKVRIALGLLLLLVFSIGALRLQISDDASEAMLPTDPGTIARYEDYLARFPSDQGALIVFVDLLCNPDGWLLMQEVERRFRTLEDVERTVSLMSASSRMVRRTQDELMGESIDLSIFADIPFADAQARCTAARDYPPFNRMLVSGDGRATALLLIAAGDLHAVDFAAQLRETILPFTARAQALGGQIIVTGEAVMSAELSNVVARDSVFVGVILCMMLVLLFAITRSWQVVGCAALLNVFVLAVAYGFMGWMQISLTPATSMVVFLLVPLSSAFVIHAHGYIVRAQEAGGEQATRRLPFILAGVSTAVGFACTGLTPAPDVQMLALMGFVGIAAATLGVFLFVFPFLDQRPLRYVLRFAVPRRFLANPIYGVVLLVLLLAICIGGLARTKIDYGPSDYLPLSNPVRADFEQAGQWFGRMNLPLMVFTEDAQDPGVWLKLRPLVEELYATYGSGFQVSWFYDHLSELTQAMTSDAAQAGLEFPEDAETFAQLALWFDPQDLELFMDEDRERVLLLMQIPYLGSHDYFVMKDRVASYLAEHDIDGHFVGRVSSFFETGHRIGADNLVGLSVGAVIIFFILWALFRSVVLAAIGIIVNGLPVLAGLAALGWAGVPIDLGSSVVAAMAFGIVLDDSSHLLVRVQQLVKSGYDPATGVVRAVGDLMAPILTTSAIICVGFTALYLAEMRPFNDFATVILITLVSALITDLMILPIMVRRFFRDPLGRMRSET